MDFTKLLGQMPHGLRSIQWHAQTIALSVLACVVLLGIAAVQKQASPVVYEPLFAEVPTAPFLQRAEAALGKTELKNHKVERGRLLVPPHERSRYLAVLQEANCLLPTFDSPTEEALRISSIIESWRKSSQRMHHAKEQRASLAIRALPGVDDAFVFFDEKTERSNSIRNDQRTTAIVGIQTVPGQPLDLRSFRMIQKMLLGIKAGLTENDMTITDLNAKRSFRGPIDELGSPEMQVFLRESLEREWKEKIATALSFLPEAKINVRVVPNSDGTAAESVKVSVGVTSNYIRRSGDLAADATITSELVQQTRAEVQSAIEPLLPEMSDTTDELIVVKVFDVARDSSALAKNEPTIRSSAILTSVLLLALIACVGLLLIPGSRSAKGSTDSDKEPSLRLYESDKVHEHNVATDQDQHGSGPTATLRAYVEDDPDAVAKSLSEFIDRAS